MAIVLCALAAAFVYTPTLRYQLVWDDQDIVVRSRSSPFEAFAHSFWHGGGAGVLGKDPYYRPLANLSLGLDELVAGHRAWYFHLVNLLLHAGVVALLGVLVWQLFGSFWTLLLAGMVCVLHPLAADSVAYVSGRTDLLAGVGLLVALLGLVRLHRRHDWMAPALVWVGFAFGVFSKETAVMFPIAAAACVLASGPRRLNSRDWAALAGVVVPLGAYLVARHAVLGSVVGVPLGGNTGAWLLVSLNDFGRLLLVAVLPWVQKVFVWAKVGPGRFTWYAIVGVLFLVLPLAVRRLRRSRGALVGWLWGATMLLPFAGLAGFGPVGRLLYIPGIGLLILALYAGRAVTRAVPGVRSVALVAALGYWAVTALLVLPGRMMVWKDGYTLFRQMTEQAPLYPAAHFNYAFQLRQRGDDDAAITEYRKAIALDPNMALAYSNLGALLQSRGELVEAESLYLRTTELRPGYALAWNNLAIVRYRQGDGPGAVRAFRRAIELRPDDGGALYNLGRVYQQAGMSDSAALLFERAYRLEPGNAQIRASYEQTHGQ